MTTSDTGPILQAARAIITVHAEPDARSVCTSEALYGECLQVLEALGHWYRVRLCSDGYEGHVRANELVVPTATTSHQVVARSTLLFAEPDLKSTVRHRIPFGSRLALTTTSHGPFSQTACGHHVWTDHCATPGTASDPSPLALAQRVFLGTPYRWGGRSPEGADCSGLVQALAAAFGHAIPRDSGDQEHFLTQDVALGQRNAQDLVYWPGHVGMLVDADRLLHATAHSLDCLVEPLQAVIDRAGPVRSVKRLFTE